MQGGLGRGRGLNRTRATPSKSASTATCRCRSRSPRSNAGDRWAGSPRWCCAAPSMRTAPICAGFSPTCSARTPPRSKRCTAGVAARRSPPRPSGSPNSFPAPGSKSLGNLAGPATAHVRAVRRRAARRSPRRNRARVPAGLAMWSASPFTPGRRGAAVPLKAVEDFDISGKEVSFPGMSDFSAPSGQVSPRGAATAPPPPPPDPPDG